MLLRQLKKITAGLAVAAAVCAAPACGEGRRADPHRGTEQHRRCRRVPPVHHTVRLRGDHLYGVAFTNVLVTVSTNSASPSLVASLTPSFTGQLSNSFSVAQDSKLRITVTDDGFTPLGPTGTLLVETSGSTGLGIGGVQTVASESRIYNPGAASSSPLNPPPASGQVPTTSGSLLADGQTIAGPINLLTPDGTRVTGQTAVAGLVSPFAIQQTILVSFSGNIPANATFGATGGASVTSNAAPVPAPGGLALALAAGAAARAAAHAPQAGRGLSPGRRDGFRSGGNVLLWTGVTVVTPVFVFPGRPSRPAGTARPPEVPSCAEPCTGSGCCSSRSRSPPSAARCSPSTGCRSRARWSCSRRRPSGPRRGSTATPAGGPRPSPCTPST
jgi:hypothetical protein